MNNHLLLLLLLLLSLPLPPLLLSLSSHLYMLYLLFIGVYKWACFIPNYCAVGKKWRKIHIRIRTTHVCLIKMCNYCKINVIHATWSSLLCLSSPICASFVRRDDNIHSLKWSVCADNATPIIASILQAKALKQFGIAEWWKNRETKNKTKNEIRTKYGLHLCSFRSKSYNKQFEFTYEPITHNRKSKQLTDREIESEM